MTSNDDGKERRCKVALLDNVEFERLISQAERIQLVVLGIPNWLDLRRQVTLNFDAEIQR